MSVDPLAAGGADLAALLDAEIASLAADAQALSALLVEGAVVSARVLPSNGLTDLLDIAGRRVAASLPPTVRPGDVVAVRVTGFDGGRILLQIVDGAGTSGAADTSGTAAGTFVVGTPAGPVAPSAAAFVPGSIRPAAPPPAADGEHPAASQPTTARPGPVAPGAFTRPGLLGGYAPALGRPAAPIPGQPGATVAVPLSEDADGPTTIETRLAAANAALAPGGIAARVAQPGTGRLVAPPPIAPKAGLAEAAGAPTVARATGLSAFAEPAALLRGLRLPVTPANLAAAALALDRPERLPAALAALERALPNASADPHVATLRALLPFVGRIEPDSPVLATQIAAFVDHVVDGAEPKLATLLAASAASASPASAGAGSATQTVSVVEATVPAALAAERAAALGSNLKQNVLALAAGAADGGTASEPLGPALAGALTALTAVQTQAAQLLAGRPDGLAFTLPLTTPFGQQNARIAVQREAPQGRGAPLDGANFRIAFVLETAHYGTVALDLVTVGRDVTVDVRAESALAVRAFRDALGGLTARLESLRYRVASAGAVMGPIASVPSPTQPAARAAGAVDRSA
jgi:hypothetical protein